MYADRRILLQCLIAGLSDIGTFLFLYLSYRYIKVGLATMLNFVYPIMVALALHFIYKEKYARRIFLYLSVYLIGMFLLCGAETQGHAAGYILALLSGIAYTFQIIYLDKSGLAGKSVIAVGFYKSCMVAAIMLAIGFACRVPFALSGTAVWIRILVISILCRFFSSALVMIGVRVLGSFLPAVLSTFEPIVTLICGWIFLEEHISVIQIIGILMILCAILRINFLQQDSQSIRKGTE